jgi:thioredoxin-related protein
MTKKAIFIPLILAALGLSAFAYQNVATKNKNIGETKADAAAIEWHTFDKGLELAQKEKKLFVVDFYTDWCHWCKVMDKDTYGNKEVIAFARQNAILAKVNAETDEKFKFKGASYSGRELSMMFGVRGFPTTSFLNDKGELITSISGYIQADRFNLILKFLAGNWYEKMKFEEFAKKEESKGKS